MIQTVYAIASRMYKAVKPTRDTFYRLYIRTFPCCACGQSWWVEAAHTGPHALSRKASDATCIPLCRKCHQAFDKAPAKFAYAHQMDVDSLTTMFQHLYRMEYPEKVKEAA